MNLGENFKRVRRNIVKLNQSIEKDKQETLTPLRQVAENLEQTMNEKMTK